jgi:tripartite tricarboxylate transporter TctB family protein
MSTDSRGYWREEFALIAMLLLFFVGIVALSYHLPFDARLFPIVIGSAGILLTLGIAVEQMRRRGARDASTVDEDDPAAKADWPRYATALLAAPAFGLLFWLFGFIIASLAAMLLIPVLMGYANRRQLVVTALLTVAILALIGPYLLNVDLPHGLVGDWLIDKLALRAS